MRGRSVSVFLLGMLVVARTFGAGSYILDWLPQTETSEGVFEALHDRLNRWLDVVVRYTSPDLPRSSRRLWRVLADGSGACLVTPDTGVSKPRWGKTNYIAYFVDADTNGDGKIDFRDEFELRVIPAGGGPSRALGQAASACWSPDGKCLAILHNQQMEVIDLSGQTIAPASHPGGEVVVTDSLNPELASDFRAVDVRTGTSKPLGEEMAKKYHWLSLMSPSGTRVVYPNATRKSLLVRGVGESAGHKLIGGDALYLDPAWSADEKHVAYVSTEAEGEICDAGTGTPGH